jgi:hypothetical protein
MTRKIKSYVKCMNTVEINPAAQCANAHLIFTAPGETGEVKHVW